VYGEDEYLVEHAPAAEGEPWAPHQANPNRPPLSRESPVGLADEPHRSRSRRLLGLGLLVGVSVGSLGLVALNRLHPRRAEVWSGGDHSAQLSDPPHASTTSLVRGAPYLPDHASSPPFAVSHPLVSPSVRSPIFKVPWVPRAVESAAAKASSWSRERRCQASERSEPDPIGTSVDGEFGFEQ